MATLLPPRSPAFQRILQLVQASRDELNRDERVNSRFIHHFRQQWEPVCACLDALEDTSLALAGFAGFKGGTPADYLAAFGMLQALIVQQDALDQLETALRLDPGPDRLLTQIREHRNNIAGHSTQRRDGHANFLLRDSLKLKALTYLKPEADGELKTVKLDLGQALDLQSNKVAARMEAVLREVRALAERL